VGAVDQIIQQHAGWTGLVNNAGGQYPSLLEDISLKGWDAVVRTNLYAPFIVSLACFKAWFNITAARLSVCSQTSGGPCLPWVTQARHERDQELHRDRLQSIPAATAFTRTAAAATRLRQSL